ncbi:MAG: hypothetical protein PVF56_15680 [Desulfobacterales bacterium]|jgi:hypothetical protein
MTDQTEKRTRDRYNQEACIAWTYFNTDHLFSGKLLNYSESGLCFESEIKLRPGATIYIRLDKFSPDPSNRKLHEGFRTVTLGEAKWCKEIYVVGSHKYAIGIKYYQPY